MGNFVYIICPVYNAQDYISSTIESVLTQTYRNWKLICVDDCSVDASTDRILAYQDKEERIVLLRCEVNSGPAHARNIGIKYAIAHGAAYLAFIDSDDQYESIFLEKMMNAMEETNADITWCNTLSYRLSEKKDVVIISHQKRTRLFLPSDSVLSFFYENIGGLGSMCNKIYRVSLIRQLGSLIDEKRVMGEDWDFNLRLFMLNPTLYTIEKPLYNYIHPDRPSVITTFRRRDFQYYCQNHRVLKQLAIERHLMVNRSFIDEQMIYFIIAHFQLLLKTDLFKNRQLFDEIFNDCYFLKHLRRIHKNKLLVIRQKVLAYCIKFRLRSIINKFHILLS